MSGRIGLREESRLGRLLARRIAHLFPRPLQPVTDLRREPAPWR